MKNLLKERDEVSKQLINLWSQERELKSRLDTLQKAVQYKFIEYKLYIPIEQLEPFADNCIREGKLVKSDGSIYELTLTRGIYSIDYYSFNFETGEIHAHYDIYVKTLDLNLQDVVGFYDLLCNTDIDTTWTKKIHILEEYYDKSISS